MRVPPAPEAAEAERAADEFERRVLPAAALRTGVIQGQVLLQMRCYGLRAQPSWLHSPKGNESGGMGTTQSFACKEGNTTESMVEISVQMVGLAAEGWCWCGTLRDVRAQWTLDACPYFSFQRTTTFRPTTPLPLSYLNKTIHTHPSKPYTRSSFSASQARRCRWLARKSFCYHFSWSGVAAVAPRRLQRMQRASR